MIDPRLCRGSLNSFTITEINGCPSNVNSSEFTGGETSDEKCIMLKSYELILFQNNDAIAYESK